MLTLCLEMFQCPLGDELRADTIAHPEEVLRGSGNISPGRPLTVHAE